MVSVNSLGTRWCRSTHPLPQFPLNPSPRGAQRPGWDAHPPLPPAPPPQGQAAVSLKDLLSPQPPWLPPSPCPVPPPAPFLPLTTLGQSNLLPMSVLNLSGQSLVPREDTEPALLTGSQAPGPGWSLCQWAPCWASVPGLLHHLHGLRAAAGLPLSPFLYLRSLHVTSRTC